MIENYSLSFILKPVLGSSIKRNDKFIRKIGMDEEIKFLVVKISKGNKKI